MTETVVPGSSFFRREIFSTNKVSTIRGDDEVIWKVSRYTQLEWWEIGNEQFAELYEAAFMTMMKTGYYNLLFSYWNETHYNYQDCIPQSGFRVDSLEGRK